MNKESLLSLAKGAGLAGGGAALTYVAQWAASTDLGIYGPAVAALSAVGINALRKYLAPPPTPTPKPAASPVPRFSAAEETHDGD